MDASSVRAAGTAAVDHEAHHFVRMDIQHPGFDQGLVRRRVEMPVADNISDMSKLTQSRPEQKKLPPAVERGRNLETQD